jgi:hypothetical protein
MGTDGRQDSNLRPGAMSPLLSTAEWAVLEPGLKDIGPP